MKTCPRTTKAYTAPDSIISSITGDIIAVGEAPETILLTRQILYAINAARSGQDTGRRVTFRDSPVAKMLVAAVITLNEVIQGAIEELNIEPWMGGEWTSIYTLPYL